MLPDKKQPKKRAVKPSFLPITSAVINDMENEIQVARPIPRTFTRLCTSTLFLTYPQCSMEKQDAYDYLNTLRPGSLYFLVSREVHVDGNFHLHMFIQFSKKIDTNNCKYFDMIDKNGRVYHGNYQSACHPDAVIDYCKKFDQIPLEIGLYNPMDQSAIQKRAIENKLKLAMTLPYMVDEGIISLKDLPTYHKAIALYNLEKVQIHDQVPRVSIWIYGAAGSGKSRYVRDEFTNAFYSKPLNKWWDSYVPTQKIVVLDDVSLTSNYLGDKLKIWADDYSFVGETKGATIKPNYGIFLVTSQYLPEDIWCPGFDQVKWDKCMQDAIERRFIICSINLLKELVVHQKPHHCNSWANHLNVGDSVDVEHIYTAKRDQFAAQELANVERGLAKTKKWNDLLK